MLQIMPDRFPIFLIKLKLRLQSIGSFFLILILLPYVITVFLHGTERPSDAEHQNQYLIGLLAASMPADYEAEALKCQAILLRTEYFREGKKESGEALTPEQMADKWGADNYEKNYQKIKSAVEETGKTVLKYNGTYALTPFHQSNNGSTRSGQEVLKSEAYPYLKAVACETDKEADAAIHIGTYSYQEVQHACHPYLVAVEVSGAEAPEKEAQEEKAGETEMQKREEEKEAKAAEAAEAELENQKAQETQQKELEFSDLEVVQTDSAGYALQIRVGRTTCSGEEFRQALGLASCNISFQERGEELQITTVGNGHGLGMSQWTANEMAKEGKSMQEILGYFFEGVEVDEI
ncbi:MAG: SpoIID/LytB domain-containing protein [Hespellia sp.]|nr:SpoIID/LytB domain-containing protein [Hespellia sp.]